MKEFKADGQEYKCEHIDQDLADGTISTYTQGAFTDLCRGPPCFYRSYQGNQDNKLWPAFWRGDAKREQMTRIYGVTFLKKMLDEYLVMLEEAKKRDHRKIGKEMELFMFSDRVGKGLPIWLPKERNFVCVCRICCARFRNVSAIWRLSLLISVVRIFMSLLVTMLIMARQFPAYPHSGRG